MANINLGATTIQPDKEPIELVSLIGSYPHTAALKSGQVQSSRVRLQDVGIMPVFPAFKRVVRELAFEVSEIATVTFLMAKDRGVPLILVPAVLIGRYQHPALIYNVQNGPLKPKDLEGRRVGVRSYSVTSGAWVRGFLQNDHGVDLTKIRWITFEDAHVAGYQDPPWAQRAPDGSSLSDMVLSGELDAAIAELPTDPRIKSVLTDPVAEARRWAVDNGATPTNHMLAIRADRVRSNPWLPSEIYRMLLDSKAAAAPPADGEDLLPFGVSANLAALDIIAFYAHQQGLVSRRYKAEEFFDETTRHLD